MDPCQEWNDLARTSRSAEDRGERWRQIVVKFLECNKGVLDELKENPDRAEFRADEMIRVVTGYGFSIGQGDRDAYRKKTREQMLALAAKHEKPVAKTTKKSVDKKADPVVMWSGELVYDVADLHLRGGGLDFRFVRTYKHQADYQGPLGHRWDHVYNAWLRISGDEAVLSLGDLSTRGFRRHPRFGDPGFDYWLPPDGTDAVLLEEGDDFVVRRPDGTRLRFEMDPFTQTFMFRLVTIEDRHGNALRLEHDARGVTRIVVNGASRFVVFGYDDEQRITSLTDHSGRRWNYRYDDWGDLSAVVAPTGEVVLYEYTSPWARIGRQHRMTRVTDPGGRIHLEVAYGDDGSTLEDDRVVRQRQGGGEFLFAYEDIAGDPFAANEAGTGTEDPDEPVRATILIGRGGHQQRHLYNASGNLLSMEETAVIGGRARRLTARYRYDADGSLIASRTPEGVVTQHLYGREVFLRRHGLADAASPEAVAILDRATRQGFGRLLATVRRARRQSASFPDIFVADPDDIIEKLTYEDEFNQLASRSDPRFTRSADPGAAEDPLYHATLTRCAYDGSTRLLASITQPLAENPDGTAASQAIERFIAYDARGRLLRHQDPSGLMTAITRFGAADGAREGLVREEVRDPAGLAITTRYELDDLGRVVSIVRPRGVESGDGRFVERFDLDALDRTIRTTASAPFLFETRNTYDASGMLAREERDSIDAAGNPLDGGPVVRTWEYNEDLLLVTETLGSADVLDRTATRHRYDAFGALAITFQPAGNRTRFRYDARGLPTAQTHGYGTPDAARRSCDFDGDGRLFRSRDARDFQTNTTFDEFGRAVAAEDPLGNIVRHTFSKTGQILVERVFERRDNGHVLLTRSERRYDAMDRLIVEITNDFDEPVPVLDVEDDFVDGPGPGAEIVWHTFYEAGGRIIRRVEVTRNVDSRFEYDSVGRLAAEADAGGNRTVYTYDLHGNPTRGDRFEGGQVLSWEATYDELDRVVARTDALGNTTRFQYDSLNRVSHTTDPLGNIREARYNPLGRLEADVMHMTADGLGSGTPQPPVVTRYEYDANGNRTAVIDPLGRRTQFEFDALDRRVARIDAAGGRTSFTYDQDAHIVRVVTAAGRELVRTYDPLGRILTVQASNAAVPGARAEHFVWNALGQTVLEENDYLRVELRRDSRGLPIEERQTWLLPDVMVLPPLRVERHFDAGGRLVELEYPNGRRIRYDRDPLGGLTAVTNLANGTDYPGTPALADQRSIVDQIQVAGRRRRSMRFGNGMRTSYQHDGVGRIIEIEHAAAGGSLLGLQYLCDGAANVRFENELVGVVGRGRRHGYDSLRRLVRSELRSDLPVFGAGIDVNAFTPASAVLPAPLPNRQALIDAVLAPLELPGQMHFVYDAAGNRREEQREGGPAIYSVNDLDQYTNVAGVTLAYDADGNLISAAGRNFGYDAWGRLVAVDEAGQQVLRFFHDTRGRRIALSQGASTVLLVHDDDRLIEERQGASLIAQWVNDDGLDRPFHLATTGEDLFYHADLQGSVRLLTGNNGQERARYRYSPFGVPEAHPSVPHNPLRYTGRWLDASLESYDFRARQYEPRLGRFMQRDPLEAAGVLYAYAGNNPVAFNDPHGTTRKEVVKGDAANRAPVPKGDADTPPTTPPAPPPEPPKPPPQPVPTVVRGILTDDQLEVINGQIKSQGEAILRLEAKDRDLAGRVPQLKTRIFEAERWEWPNWGTAATVVDWGEKIVGLYIGKVFWAVEIGSGVVGTVDDDAGRAIGYANAATKGAKTLASEAVTDAGAWGFKKLHKQSEQSKKQKGAVIREELKGLEKAREQIKTQIETIKKERTRLQQQLVDDQQKVRVVPMFPDGGIAL